MNNRSLVVCYLLAVWFVISFVTNIIGPLMPSIITDFHLSLILAGFLPFSFFLAYGIVSIPAGIMVEAWGAKRTLLVAFGVNVAGTAALSLLPTYMVAVGALFVTGMGMAMLQVVINPLMRTAGGEKHFAFFSVLGQLVFGLASFISPLLFSALMAGLSTSGGHDQFVPAPRGPPWVIFYWGFTAIFAFALIATAVMKIPEVDLKGEERPGALSAYVALLKELKALLFFLGIAAYVGTEQILANWMSQFLSTYHGISPVSGGAQAVAQFWGLMSLGCLIGLGLLKLFDSKLVLQIFTALAIVCVGVALTGGREVATAAFPASGFFLSVMFSIIFSLALNSVPRNHGAFSGILCSGILGGALFPFIVGALGDYLGLRTGMMVAFGTLGFIFSIGVWAKPLVRNDVIQLSDVFSRRRRDAVESR
jgi:fucose permease